MNTRKKTKKFTIYIFCILLATSLLFLSGCNSSTNMKDGFYTAEMSAYEFGWKEYVCILVKDNKIVSAEFNAKDSNGYIKAWDNEYMRSMLVYGGKTYPNEYTRKYVEQLLQNQNAKTIDAISGATTSGNNFNKLATAVIQQAQTGNLEVVTVPATP